MFLHHPPVSQRLHEALQNIIEGMKTGERLPSEPELARQLGVSRATLREVMRTFETQGVLHRRQGSGTYVFKPLKIIESGLEVLESIETLANRIGLPVSHDESILESRPASVEEALALEIKPGDIVTSISRVILADRQPAAYLIDILPEEILDPGEIDSGFRGSVLDLLLHRQDPNPVSSRCEIRPVTANPEIARALAIQRGDVLLCFESMLYSHLGKVMDYSFSYFLPGYFRFHVVRRVGR
jgi:GntR family transcriptional regulator